MGYPLNPSWRLRRYNWNIYSSCQREYICLCLNHWCELWGSIFSEYTGSHRAPKQIKWKHKPKYWQYWVRASQRLRRLKPIWQVSMFLMWISIKLDLKLKLSRDGRLPSKLSYTDPIRMKHWRNQELMIYLFFSPYTSLITLNTYFAYSFLLWSYFYTPWAMLVGNIPPY